uniref:Diguanylate cyclase/phosphodiesterase (GGDEF & EAL domains) with PAS/PAC sensor(S) n=1 Tax=uncultured bacterium A1Q1_fos_862 TaxID=1256590 RepID=L7W1S9_9BACT|nr:diguanylate cyclase/phosphodiesterase (GGDEF & EAL domains) with PAS/PAC sensor(s) [uncultured bacterium A1Q1_fos_862]
MSDTASDIRDSRGFLATAHGRYLLFAFAWYIVFLALPDVLAGPWYLAFSISTLVLVSRHLRTQEVRIRKATSLIIGAGVLSLIGAAVRGVHAILSGSDNPFPSPAEVFSLASYLMLIVAIGYIVRQRSPRLGLDPILDAVVGGVAAGVLQWTLVLVPYLQATSSDLTSAEVLNVLYAVVSLLLVIAAVMALVAGSTPSTSNRLLALGLVFAAGVDMIYTLASAGRVPDGLQLLVSPLALLFSATGLLHPSLRLLLERPTDLAATRRVSRRRITVLSLALLTPPLLLLWGGLRGDFGLELLLPVLGAVTLAPLVIVRLGRLVGQNEELAALEASLRAVGERLVSAETAEDVARIVTVGAEHVLQRCLASGGLMLDPLGAGMVEHSGDLSGPIAELRAHLLNDGSPDSTTLVPLRSETDGVHAQAGLVVLQREVRAALVLVTTRQLTEDESNAVATLCRETAIALRAVEQTELQVKQRSEARFASLIDNSSDIVAVLNERLELGYVSPVATRLLGFGLDHIDDVDVLRLIHPEDRDAATKLITDIQFGARESAELRLHHADGTFRWFDVNGTDLTSDPNINGLVLNLREVSDRKAAEEMRALSEARFMALVQNSTDLVVVFDSAGAISYASPSVEAATGLPKSDILATSIESLFPESDADWKAVLSGASTDQTAGSALFEIKYRNSAAEVRTIETLVSDLRNEPAVHGFVLNARDVTERRGMEQRLRYQATHDELTGMFNRVQGLSELDGMLGRNSGSTTVAAMLIGLDDFKEVNESLGHAVGDRLLREAGSRITELLDYGDIAARVGGDEFAVVIECSRGENQVTDLVNRVLAAIALPYDVDGRELSITASAGIVFDHDRSSTGEVILRNADIAMFHAKSRGKRQVVVFESQMHTASFDRMEMRGDLARAVASDQFVAHYQPVIDIETRQIVGAEALIRWNHPERGLISPGLFIPLAEETGMIGALGEWILERACTDMARWRADFGEIASDLTISVNLAVQQLHDDLILDKVRNILARTGLPAQRLVLEVTESTLITETDKATRTMQELRSMGARLAVDDFGTGYSSLGYIQQFEFDVLKIDKSFIDGIESETNAQIVAAVLELAKQLKVRTIAEGIETEEQDRILTEIGCRYGQGFLYSRPVPERDFRELLVSDRARSTTRATL